jgi:CRISPR-associated exonuclease Cas4
MLGQPVPAGAIYYHASRRRREVVFTEEDQTAVARATADVRVMLRGTTLPEALDDLRCPNCSLIDACQPALTAHPARIRGHYAELFHPHDAER